jgi:hypothetical protein
MVVGKGNCVARARQMEGRRPGQSKAQGPMSKVENKAKGAGAWRTGSKSMYMSKRSLHPILRVLGRIQRCPGHPGRQSPCTMNWKAGSTRSREAAKGAKNGSLRRDAARDPRDARATPGNGGRLARVDPGFHAQVVDFPHIARGKMFSACEKERSPSPFPSPSRGNLSSRR